LKRMKKKKKGEKEKGRGEEEGKESENRELDLSTFPFLDDRRPTITSLTEVSKALLTSADLAPIPSLYLETKKRENFDASFSSLSLSLSLS